MERGARTAKIYDKVAGRTGCEGSEQQGNVSRRQTEEEPVSLSSKRVSSRRQNKGFPSFSPDSFFLPLRNLVNLSRLPSVSLEILLPDGRDSRGGTMSRPLRRFVRLYTSSVYTQIKYLVCRDKNAIRIVIIDFTLNIKGLSKFRINDSIVYRAIKIGDKFARCPLPTSMKLYTM